MLKTFTLTVVTLSIFNSVHEFQKEFPQPVQVKEDAARTEARYALQELGAPPEKIETLTRSTYAAGIGTEIDPVLIATIMKPESDFKINAKSPKGYKSLMQSNKAVMNWDYAEANTMYGACKLRDKLRAAKGDMNKAMVFYKGHGGKESQQIAAKQMELYREIKRKVSKRIEMEKNNG